MAEYLLFVQALYALGALVALGAGGVLWRHRERTGARALLAMMGGMVIWSGSLFVLTVTGHPTTASLSLRTVFVGVAIVSLTKLVFVLEYTGREHLLRPRILGLLAVPPVVLVLFAFTNPADSFFTTLEATDEGPLPIAFEFGPAVLFHFVYAYALNVAVTVLILGFLYRSQSIYRGQSLALLGGSIAPWIANAMYAFEIVAFDTTPIGGIVSGLLFVIAVVRYRLLDLMPIARERVLDTVSDAVFVVGPDDRLVDVNPTGRQLLATIDVERDDPIGRSFPSLVDGTELREQYETATSAGGETTTHVAIRERHFRVDLTPIEDGRDRDVGWLIIAHDVTQRYRREEELEAQNNRLDRFASLVSHDLRNPLTVASGHLDLARTTDDSDDHLEIVAESHDRMETIIGDVLALAREGTDVTDPEPVSLEAVAKRSWDGVDTGGASLTIEGDPSILVDPDRLQRLFENLYRNAVEHGSTSPASQAQQDAVEHGSTSPDSQARQDTGRRSASSEPSVADAPEDAVEHGSETSSATGLEVTVGAIGESTDGSIAGFYVADDGIGIPACRRDQVLEDGYSTGEDGTGLGLSIVESIAAAHGWSLNVDESAAGGVRFEFTGVESDDRSAMDVDDRRRSTPFISDD